MFPLSRMATNSIWHSPVNTVLNFYANQLDLDYDDKAHSQKQEPANLLNELNRVKFYHRKHQNHLDSDL
jgi:anhydro-N-acetylmuramic acid kinase